LVLRVLESAGLGTLVGCAVAGVLIPLLMWRGVSTFPPALAALLVGGVSGTLWSLARRPTPVEAALEADRQLGLSDLLATALLVTPRSRESDRDADAAPWLQTVIATANETCQRHAPSQVVMHRLGGRAWGGIALAAALVLTLATLTAQEPAARASAAPAGRAVHDQAVVANAAKGIERAATGARAAERSRSPGTGPESAGAGKPFESGSDPNPSAAAAASGGGKTTGSSGDTGTGGGAGRARKRTGNNVALTPDPDPASAQASNVVGARGTGAAATRPSVGEGGSGGTVAPDASRAQRLPAWESSEWPDDARRAREAVEGGQVPDSRRDLVRQYFDRG
jgi:hypothetical protein